MTAFERFRAKWLQSHPPEDDSCDCMSYSRALWDAATEAARSCDGCVTEKTKRWSECELCYRNGACIDNYKKELTT